MEDENPAIEDVYILDKVIGEGSFGLVKKAIKKDTGVAYAVKMLYKEKLETEEIDRLQLETEILTEIDHPNVVKYFEFYEDDDYIYMVQELVTGGELFQRIVETDHFSERQAADIIRTIINALRYCHTLGVTHSYLKPENLLYASNDPSAVIKISDFGLARFVNNSNMTTMSKTLEFLAPEIILGKRQDTAIDYWSVGVILYFMLCGFLPFYSENNNELFEIIVKGKLDFPSPAWDSISNEAKDLIQGLLTIDPLKRFNYERVIQHPWLNGKSSESSIPDIQKNIKNYLNKKYSKLETKLRRLEDLKFKSGADIRRKGEVNRELEQLEKSISQQKMQLRQLQGV